MFTLATVVGQSVPQLTQGTIVANLGFEEVAFPHPLFHGDTLYSSSEVLGARPSASRWVRSRFWLIGPGSSRAPGGATR